MKDCGVYYLIDEKRKDNCISHINSLVLGDEYEVVIQERVKTRSKAQNRLYWKWIDPLSKHCGYDKEQMHVELAYEFLGEQTYVNRKGITRVRPKSTRELSVEDFTNYLRKIEQLAFKLGVSLPITDDYNYAMMIK